MTRSWFLALFLTSVVVAQTGARVIWEPPNWNFPQDVKATVPREMLSKLRVANVAVTLEKTKLDNVEQLLGGTTGASGDAGDAVKWLCFQGMDGGDRWILWLQSGEIDGPSIGSFQWQRVSTDAKIDRRCRALGRTATVRLALPLSLGMNEADVLKVLGTPSFRRGEKLIYLHEHEESINAVQYDSSNIVMVRVHGGAVTSVAVSKTTSD